MAQKLPGNGLLGWLGRQFGHVKKAVEQDVTRRIIHRRRQVQQAVLPQRPDVTLRRTVIDEVIVQKTLPTEPPAPRRTQSPGTQNTQ